MSTVEKFDLARVQQYFELSVFEDDDVNIEYYNKAFHELNK